MRKTLFMASLVVCAVLLVAGAAAAADNWIGTWKLDLTQSKFSPGPPPKSLTVKFATTPDGVKFTSDGIDAEGKPTHTEWVSKLDGKDVPYMGNPNADTASPKRIDANSYGNTWKKDGKVTITAHAVVSKDGKTFTVHQTGKSAKGEPADITAVFTKQ